MRPILKTGTLMKSGNHQIKASEWRIKPIPFRDPYLRLETNWGAVFGALLFLGGIVAGFKIEALFVVAIEDGQRSDRHENAQAADWVCGNL